MDISVSSRMKRRFFNEEKGLIKGMESDISGRFDPYKENVLINLKRKVIESALVCDATNIFCLLVIMSRKQQLFLR